MSVLPFAAIGPPPRFEVTLRRSLRVPMRDGTRLSTDLYWPERAGERLPVLLLRTPYNKRHWRGDPVLAPRAQLFAGQGFAVAVQDMRGRFESEGEFTIAFRDGQDGFDSVEWLVKQPWCDGSVGTYGCSYMGETQVYLSRLRHPCVKAMVSTASGGATGSLGGRYTRWGFRHGGALNLGSVLGWMLEHGSKLYARLPPELDDAAFARCADLFDLGPRKPPCNVEDLWKRLPLLDAIAGAGAPPTDFEDVLRHDFADPWWDQFDYLSEQDEPDVPMIHVDSWFDPCVAETLERFEHFRGRSRSELARRNQLALISPMAHCQSEYATAETVVGERSFGDARFDFWGLYVRWFDHWLRGGRGDFEGEPPVRYFVTGRNRWEGGPRWPPADANAAMLYLRGLGSANTNRGDGRLSTEPGPIDEPADAFVYDPGNPVPSRGGPVFLTGSLDLAAGAYDQAQGESRGDVLVYSTEPLIEELEIAGFPKVILFVESDAPDTDFTAKLVDVLPDGRAFNVQEGILRARYREGMLRTTRMQPGRTYRLVIDLQAAAHVFGPGHRCRLEVSSSNFPRFDRNLNTGGDNISETAWRVARNVVRHDSAHPSHLLLPIRGDVRRSLSVRR